MKRRIIDSHAHLGDIFHENRNVTFKTGIKLGSINKDDPLAERINSGYTVHMDPPDDFAPIIRAGQYRSWEWTLENCSADMDTNGIDYIAMLPIWPNTTFEEYLAASKLDPRLIPFTSVDYSLPIADSKIKLRKDIDRGAKGLKLHPTIQDKALDDPRTEAALTVFAQAGLPVITHVGVNPYYTPDQPYPSNPQLSAPEKVWQFCRNHPELKIICAHFGRYVEEFMAGVGDLDYVYTDTTMCSADMMARFVEKMGPDRLLFATDVPFSSTKALVGQMELAFADRPDVADKVFFTNMADLIHLPYEPYTP